MKKSDLKEYSKPSLNDYGKIEEITATKDKTLGDGQHGKAGSKIA